MPVTIIRVLKGIAMGALFGFFLLGILFVLLIMLPILLLLDRTLGPNPCRMQAVIRLLIRLWLFLLRGCGLLSAKAGQGKPMDEACVIVANHPGLFDILFLIRDIPRLSIMVKRTLATKLPLGPIFRSAGYILSPDFEQRGPLDCLEEARALIRQGYKFMIFPEGTRSPKGRLGKFHAGAFLLARLSKVPVQPLLFTNTPPFLPKRDRWYFPPFQVSRLTIDYWEPLDSPSSWQERESARNLEDRYKKALGLAEK